ncbi:MAG: ChbG/HpnK family deacetylase [Alphaproteobacteria bacterium]|nr:ChbG/HpnK family deacetylase [Alphaproteobacteria bacterium]
MIILNADDFGLSAGVSRGIAELCQNGRLSSTSAIVNLANWQAHAVALAELRPLVATGLHLNLTLGPPLTREASAVLAGRDGRFLPLGRVIRAAATGRLDGAALRAECAAQIDAFQRHAGHLPDFIDGHQHVHALAGIRDALLDVMKQFAWVRPPFIRVPVDRHGFNRFSRGDAQKRAMVAFLTRGFRARVEAAGLPHNDTFAGFSSFTSGRDYRLELDLALGHGGACHLVMCHPGHVDDELLRSGDAVTGRRQEELSGLMAFNGLSQRIWHPSRTADGAIDWAEMTR